MIQIHHALLFAAIAVTPGQKPAPPPALELSPAYQRLAELRAITETAGLVAALKEVPVERIEFVREDLYRVRAGGCHLDAKIVALPMPEGMVGARRFEVRLGGRVCSRR